MRKRKRENERDGKVGVGREDEDGSDVGGGREEEI